GLRVPRRHYTTDAVHAAAGHGQRQDLGRADRVCLPRLLPDRRRVTGGRRVRFLAHTAPAAGRGDRRGADRRPLPLLAAQLRAGPAALARDRRALHPRPPLRRLPGRRAPPARRLLLPGDHLLLPAPRDQGAGGEAMGVTRTAPWWLTWALLAGLVSLFLGERVFETIAPARAVLSGLGALVVLGCLAWRVASRRSAVGEAREVETLLLLTYAGCVLALVLYFISSTDGMRWLGIEFADDTARRRYLVVLHVLWPTVLAVSLLPALGAQIALGAHRHARAAGAGLEALRVRETATAALTIALAGGFLLVTGWIAAERDVTLDLSYFRTSSPGSATAAMVEGLDEPLRVLLFFPEVNPVKDEALRYFRALARASGRVTIEEHDRVVSPRLAEAHRRTAAGTVVLASGGREEHIVLGTGLPAARRALRTLDRTVQERLMALLRERRVAYLTTGHGELNDTASADLVADEGLGGVGTFQELLRLLN